MNEDKDRLRGLFQEMKLDKPSAGFESRLMQSIHAITEKQTKKEPISAKSILAIIGGILGILGIPAAILWWLGISIKPEIQPIETDFSFSMPVININPAIISIASVCLLLLVTDMLIRRRIWEKKNKD
ncbi:hypothetical protein FACS1894169_03990 [Bacteroidia bacterium]|nr:hypothetical protein FACS1894169_03990 [Bacteroidia bacterium]